LDSASTSQRDLLVSAFAGRELVLRAYREAIKQRYHFYSFEDAMLIGEQIPPYKSGIEYEDFVLMQLAHDALITIRHCLNSLKRYSTVR
jgi:hypothetical protein